MNTTKKSCKYFNTCGSNSNCKDCAGYEKKEKKYYVSMTDNFMSGWGQAKGKINKLVIECTSYEQAEIVENNARRRTEMKYINICINFPYHIFNNPNNYAQLKTIEDMPNWFKPNFFTGGK